MFSSLQNQTRNVLPGGALKPRLLITRNCITSAGMTDQCWSEDAGSHCGTSAGFGIIVAFLVVFAFLPFGFKFRFFRGSDQKQSNTKTSTASDNTEGEEECPMAARKPEFLQRVGDNYGYANSSAGFIDTWRSREFPQLLSPLRIGKDNTEQYPATTNKEVYLDHAGSALPSRSLLTAIYQDELSQSSILANPHSSGPAAARTLRLISQVKKDILDHFQGHPGRFGSMNQTSSQQQQQQDSTDNSHLYHPGYDVIFTSGTTQALRIVAEHFPWSGSHNVSNNNSQSTSTARKSMLLYPHNAHTSVVGMRGPVLAKGGKFVCKHLSEIVQLASLDDDIFENTLSQWMEEDGGQTAMTDSRDKSSNHHNNENIAHNLLVIPAECNFGGDRPDCANLLRQFRRQNNHNHTRQWSTMLDLAKAASTSPINLKELDPDFACVSFYKLFGAPTGLGALFVRRSIAVNLLVGQHHHHSHSKRQASSGNGNDIDNPSIHRYFGGGSVDVVLSSADFAVGRNLGDMSSLSSEQQQISTSGLSSLTHGTTHFRGIVALAHGFRDFNRLGGMEQIQNHTSSLANEFCRRVQSLQHGNQRPAVVLYGAWGKQQQTSATTSPLSLPPGPVVAFNILRSDGSVVGYNEVSKLAILNNPPLQLRTGCFCNPGACQDALGLSNEEIMDNYQTAGHVCGDEIDVINGKPSGAVRASFGKDTLWEDMDALILFIQRHFVVSHVVKDHEVSREEKASPRTNTKASISEMYIYPIKSCAGQHVQQWNISLPSGRLWYDREFALVDSFGTAMRLQRYPKMGTIQPRIDPDQKTLTVSAPGMKNLVLDLDQDDCSDEMKSLVSVCGNKCSGSLWGGLAASEWFSAYLGVQCWLARYSNTGSSLVCPKGDTTSAACSPAPHAFSNEKPILLISKTAVEKLNAILRRQGQPRVTARQFRPNFVVDFSDNDDKDDSSSASSHHHPEDSWQSITIVKSGTELRNSGLCARCAMVDVDPTTGTKGKTLRALAEYRRNGANIHFGIFLQGESNVGNGEEMLEEGLAIDCQ